MRRRPLVAVPHWPGPSRPWRCVLLCVSLVAACASEVRSGSGATSTGLISVSNGACGAAGDSPGPAGTRSRSATRAPRREIDLIDPANGAEYAEIENAGPAPPRRSGLDVGRAEYAFLCEFTDFDPLTGPTVTVAGQAKGTPAVPPDHL